MSAETVMMKIGGWD